MNIVYMLGAIPAVIMLSCLLILFWINKPEVKPLAEVLFKKTRTLRCIGGPRNGQTVTTDMAQKFLRIPILPEEPVNILGQDTPLDPPDIELFTYVLGAICDRDTLSTTLFWYPEGGNQLRCGLEARAHEEGLLT